MTFLVRCCIYCSLTLTALAVTANQSFCQTPNTQAPNTLTPDRPTPNSPSVDAIDPLAKEAQEAIDTSMRRYLDAKVHTPWQIIHGILALRQDYELKLDGKRINALEWISNDPVFRGEHWFEKTQTGGRAHPFSQPYAFEGHANQFLAYLTNSDLPRDHQFQTASGPITIDDMVRHAQATTATGDEPTWTLWALSHYLTPDAQWTSQTGEAWSIERLVQLQTRAPVHNAACGGTHGLFALSYARNGYIHTGQPLRGVWLEADQKIKRYIQEARSLQNYDGMFSASYFQGRRSANDFEGRIGPGGHTLEFLMMALPQDRLKEEWVRRGVHAVSRDLIDRKREPIECAALYHALDALIIYLDRTNPKPIVVKDVSETKTPEPLKVETSGAEPAPIETSIDREEELLEMPVIAPRPGGGRD